MEVAQEWPEPIVRVQTLADAEVIPERYIKPPSERPNLLQNPAAVLTASPPGGQLPVIDLGGLMTGDEAERRATMLAISDACKEWGFFQAVNHGICPELLRSIREVWRDFFNLPMEAKQAYANSPKTFEGYGSRLGVKKGAILDWGDYFFLQIFPHSVRNYNIWPVLPASLRERTQVYGEEVVKLCGVMQKVLSLSLGMEEGFLEKAFGEAGAGLRVNYYPKCQQPDLTLGLSPHSDPGGMTMLLADHHVKGLQVRRGDDAWITVEPIPNALIVNIGDQIEVLTNGIYKSVEHRVIVNAATERLSLALFYNPQDDVPIQPAKELMLSSNAAAPIYKAMTFADYKLFMRMLGPRGKAHVQSIKALP